MKYHTHTLSNGIRIVHCMVPNLAAHLGFMINTGSRHEKDDEHGLAHFIEHSLFKGTTRRKSFHIINRLENVGGELNAYTTKEETCVYASFLKNDYPRAMELFRDILFNATFPDREIRKEKQVIIDEIHSCLDNPSERIFDEFDEMVFNGQAIGRNILGSPENILRFTREDMKHFIRNHYFTDRMVIGSVGNISFDRLVRLSEKYFGDLPCSTCPDNENENILYHHRQKALDRNTHQAHCIIGNRAYHFRDKRRTALHLLNNILGGPGMNSRLNMSLREKKGYSYNTESSYIPYSDTGILSIYFGCEKAKLEKSIRVAFSEFDKLKNRKMGGLQLSRAKRQLTGQIAISAENNENLMLSIGKSMLIHNRADTPEDIAARIEAVTAEQLLDIAGEILDPGTMSLLAYR